MQVQFSTRKDAHEFLGSVFYLLPTNSFRKC